MSIVHAIGHVHVYSPLHGPCDKNKNMSIKMNIDVDMAMEMDTNMDIDKDMEKDLEIVMYIFERKMVDIQY
jgi:hypothetical protein